jgi:hypothetical protein
MYARKKRTNYQDKVKDAILKDAIKCVKLKEMNVTDAALEFKIPRQTLEDKINGNHPGTYGRSTALSAKDETVLLSYIKYMASIGHPLNVAEIKTFAWSVGK